MAKKEYTTYIPLDKVQLDNAEAPVDVPSEMDRDPLIPMVVLI